MVVGNEFCIDIITFHCFKVCSLVLVVKNLHCVVYGDKGVCLFSEVLGKFASVAVVSKCVFVFIIL